jgi:transmembrane 9 superfamily protein 2/4
MAAVTMIFALLGFLSPAHRGGLLQSVMLLFTFMGVFAGYTSARLYKVFDGDDWKVTTLMTAMFYPGIFFIVFFILNLFIWGEKSSGAVPFTTMFAILVLWFGISVPLVFLGAYFGFRKDVIELPVRTNQIPRQIPAQDWYMSPWFSGIVGGMLPFGAAFTELFFIMSSLWQHQFYYLFGFLALVLAILLVTCAEVSITMTYFHLTVENYKWCWNAFFASASSGIWVFGYSVLYFYSRLQIEKAIPTMLYFGYMFLISTMFFLLTGSIGLIAAFYFVTESALEKGTDG